MIRYNKKISIIKTQDAWFMETDRADRYDMILIKSKLTPWTEWWNMNHQSELRSWQKDIIRMFAAQIPNLTPMLVYKKQHGTHQDHDIAVAYSNTTNIWIVSTGRDFWIIENSYGQFDLLVQDSLGGVLDSEQKQQIYQVLTAFEKASLSS